MPQVNEEACRERHKNLETTVSEIKDEVMKIRILWSGNGKPGAGFKIQTMWDCFIERRQSTQGLVDWMFRAVITVLVTFIAVKVGLK
jgi:hypothetical protein